MLIAIDGGSGAGKSTIAKKLAQELDYSLVDTGAIYRAIALLASEVNISYINEDQLVCLTQNLNIHFNFHEGINYVYLGARNITNLIRTPEISQGASMVSRFPKIRLATLNLQRAMAQKDNVIMEGRDIGTVIAPNADFKFFLTAPPEIRAQRRYKELTDAGISTSLADTKREIEARDYADIYREISPLKKAEDAIEIDVSVKSIDEIVLEMLSIIRNK